MQQVPYWRLSGFYFFYFAVLGGLVPFWNLYLKHLEFTAPEIGFLSAIIMATKIIAPNIWGWLADHTGQRLRIIRIGAVCGALCFLGVFVNHSFAWFAVVIGAYSFFWNAILPQYEVVTLSHLEGRYHHYSLIRLWGSVGFIAAVLLLGAIFQYLPIDYLPHALTVMLFGILLCSVMLDGREKHHPDRKAGGFLAIARQPVVIVFFLCCFLMQVGHGPYYAFFSIYLQEHGIQPMMTGVLWALGVAAEVVLFLFMHRILQRFGIGHILMASLLLAALRWLMIGFFVDNWWMLLLAQLLHAATFGSFHAAAIEYVRQQFDGGYQGQGQALYSAMSFGAGGAVGAAASGLLWDINPVWAFVMASVAATVALVLAGIFLRDTRPA
ncbi:MAG: MFS transporter [Gammaproteobacteria bacterium]|nr:MAG: MFS transporter [Gammaproteobacteria bacterium]